MIPQWSMRVLCARMIWTTSMMSIYMWMVYTVICYSTNKIVMSEWKLWTVATQYIPECIQIHLYAQNLNLMYLYMYRIEYIFEILLFRNRNVTARGIEFFCIIGNRFSTWDTPQPDGHRHTTATDHRMTSTITQHDSDSHIRSTRKIQMIKFRYQKSKCDPTRDSCHWIDRT
jgi:hypothetical protein